MSIRNPYIRLLNTLPQTPKLLGVVTVSENGTCLVTLLGGAVVRVTGEATEGQSVFVRNGLLEGVAPSMPSGATVLPNL